MKNFISSVSLVMLLAVSTFNASAATLVEVEQTNNQVQKMWIEGDKFRVDMAGNNEYMVADYKSNKIYLIDPAKKEIMDMSQFINKDKQSSKGLKIEIKPMGKGQDVAGYQTTKFQLSANGKQCRQVLVSKKAQKDADIGRLMEALSQVDVNPMGAQFMQDCDRAGILFAREMKNMGMPLATINNGKLEDKVRKIQKNVALPAGGFKLPAGYRHVNLQQKIQDAMGSAFQGGQINPEMKKMMEDMMRQRQ
jgi:hypothetical protein